MPGATVTNFGENSGSKKALVWRLPFVTMEADEVSSSLGRGSGLLRPEGDDVHFIPLKYCKSGGRSINWAPWIGELVGAKFEGAFRPPS